MFQLVKVVFLVVGIVENILYFGFGLIPSEVACGGTLIATYAIVNLWFDFTRTDFYSRDGFLALMAYFFGKILRFKRYRPQQNNGRYCVFGLPRAIPCAQAELLMRLWQFQPASKNDMFEAIASKAFSLEPGQLILAINPSDEVIATCASLRDDDKTPGKKRLEPWHTPIDNGSHYSRFLAVRTLTP